MELDHRPARELHAAEGDDRMSEEKPANKEEAVAALRHQAEQFAGIFFDEMLLAPFKRINFAEKIFDLGVDYGRRVPKP